MIDRTYWDPAAGWQASVVFAAVFIGIAVAAFVLGGPWYGIVFAAVFSIGRWHWYRNPANRDPD